MKKLTEEQKLKIEGGSVSARACMLAGGATIVFAIAQQWGWAFGTVTAAALAGCFDK